MRVFALFLAVAILGIGHESRGGDVFTIMPARPIVGDTVRLTYDGSAPGASLGGKASLRGEALLMMEQDPPVLIPIAMYRSGARWFGGLPLNDARARLVLFRVVSEKQQDNGNGDTPFTLVYGRDGKPVAGANLQLGSLLAAGGIMDFKRQKDYAAAYAAFAEEKGCYPENWRVYPAEWSVMMRENRGEETRAKIKAALEAYYRRFQGNAEAVAAALQWFDLTGQRERREDITKAALEAAPSGPVAESARRSAIFAERDMARRAELVGKFLADFPQKAEAKDELLSIRFTALMNSNQPGKALALADSFSVPRAQLYNSIAWDWIEKGENLEQAVQLAKRGVELALHPPAGAKPTYFSDEMWKEQSDYSAAMILDTYGFGLYKLGKYADAETVLRQAYDRSNGEQPEITERLVMVYNQNGNYNAGMELGRSAVQRGKTTDRLIEYTRAAYARTNGSDRGFDSLLAQARAAGAQEMKEKVLKDRLHKPAIPFALKDLAGRTVRLEDLRGKVVVLDFWATWCGPCKSSFPTLQKIYDAYRKNPGVRILALNTWERVGGKEREDLVKKFIADNRYTFPVLYDEGIVDRYGVEGIPTKFVIDKRGDLAFKSIGFNGAEEMLNELTAQIDTLLAE